MTKARKRKKKKALKDPAAPVPFEDMDIKDWEVKIHQAVLRREKKGRGVPDRDDIFAMEEPLNRLMGGLTLFLDLAYGVPLDAMVRADGLVFLASALHREGERLYRLRHGCEPPYA